MSIGVTAKLEYASGESSYTAIPNLMSVSFPPISVGTVETTSLSVTDYGRTFESGMIDAGEISFEAMYTETLYSTLNGFLRTTKGWKVTGPTGQDAVVSFNAIITSLGVQFQPDDSQVNIACTLKVTGVPTVS